MPSLRQVRADYDARTQERVLAVRVTRAGWERARRLLPPERVYPLDPAVARRIDADP